MLDRIRETVAMYLSGRISADELPARLPDGWETDQAGDQRATHLVLRVVGNLAAFQNGDLTEADLQDRLRMLVPTARTYWIIKARLADSGSEAKVIHPDVQEASGISRVVESV